LNRPGSPHKVPANLGDEHDHRRGASLFVVLDSLGCSHIVSKHTSRSERAVTALTVMMLGR
jgi:hypothetical protein